MVSDTDLPHQSGPIQQQPLMEKKNNPIWKIIFIPLIIVNVVLISWAGFVMSKPTGAISGFVLIPASLPLAIIDILAVFFYIRKQHPQGIAYVVSYVALIIITLYLVRIVIAILLIVFTMVL